MKGIYTLFLGLIIQTSLAQTSVNLNLNHVYEGQSFALNQVIETPDSTTVALIGQAKFYRPVYVLLRALQGPLRRWDYS